MTRTAVLAPLFLSAGLAALGPAANAGAQTPPAAPAAAPGPLELYHVHFVKAAPGKLLELIDAYQSAPADPEASGPPVILRHVEGDDWHLLVIQALGADETLRVTPPPPEVTAFLDKTRGLRAMHTDTFAIGPVWAEARKALLGDAAAGAGGDAVYVATVLRSLPGHRDQLAGVLKQIADREPGTTLTLQHLEGASWEFLQVSRYASWAAFGDSLKKERGQAASSPLSTALNAHLAEHRDTLAERVAGRAAPPR